MDELLAKGPEQLPVAGGAQRHQLLLAAHLCAPGGFRVRFQTNDIYFLNSQIGSISNLYYLFLKIVLK